MDNSPEERVALTEVASPSCAVGQVTQRSPAAAKIALFRSLFRGREDVYPRRFESRKTGRAGYQPACGNEWVRGVCEKPRIKCMDCPNQRFLRVTDEVIRWHLSGRDDQGRDFVMGVYPMLRDETCSFLAVDFDRDSWQEDTGAFLETCRRLDLSAALERSRSGNGGHVWFFLTRPYQPAWRANLDPTFSRKRWRGVPILASVRTTGFSQIRTRCPEEGSET